MKRTYIWRAMAVATLAISAIPANIFAQSPASPAPIAASPAPVAPSAEAIALAGLLIPKDVFIDVNMVNFAKSLKIMATQSPELGQLFGQYPGLEAALTAAGSAQLRQILELEYPDLANKVGAFIVQRYTARETADLTKFYAGGAGKKLIRAEYQSADVGAMVEAFSDADGKLTTDEVRAMDANSIADLGKELTSAEKAVATTFFMGATG
jgi:hypothetical protein